MVRVWREHARCGREAAQARARERNGERRQRVKGCERTAHAARRDDPTQRGSGQRTPVPSPGSHLRHLPSRSQASFSRQRSPERNLHGPRWLAVPRRDAHRYAWSPASAKPPRAFHDRCQLRRTATNAILFGACSQTQHWHNFANTIASAQRRCRAVDAVASTPERS